MRYCIDINRKVLYYVLLKQTDKGGVKMGKFLTTNEVANIARTTTYTVRVWLQSKQLKGVRPGKNWLVNEDWLNEFLSIKKESSKLGQVQS